MSSLDGANGYKTSKLHCRLLNALLTLPTEKSALLSYKLFVFSSLHGIVCFYPWWLLWGRTHCDVMLTSSLQSGGRLHIVALWIQDRFALFPLLSFMCVYRNDIWYFSSSIDRSTVLQIVLYVYNPLIFKFKGSYISFIVL